MQDEGAQAPTDATGGRAQLPLQPVVEPEHPHQPQPSLPLPQQLQEPQPAAKLRQPLATPHAPRLPDLQLHDLEDDVSEGNGVACMNVLSDDDDDFDTVQPLQASADAKFTFRVYTVSQWYNRGKTKVYPFSKQNGIFQMKKLSTIWFDRIIPFLYYHHDFPSDSWPL
jgi:hypothetical protein